MKELQKDTVESSELVEETFNYWFNDQGHVRSPFPGYIQSKLRGLTIERFYDWAATLDEKAKEELDDSMVAGRFEEILFETGMEMVLTEDEKITIRYPFLPRIGDKINGNLPSEEGPAASGERIVSDRAMEKEGDLQFLKVKMQDANTEVVSETRFELPI